MNELLEWLGREGAESDPASDEELDHEDALMRLAHQAATPAPAAKPQSSQQVQPAPWPIHTAHGSHELSRLVQMCMLLRCPSLVSFFSMPPLVDLGVSLCMRSNRSLAAAAK